MSSSKQRRSVRMEGPQPVTFVELFFDLVFVFAVTQVTAFVAADLTIGAVLRSLVLFWMIWWAWTQFTWTLNPADATHRRVRAITLIATATAFVMATGVPGAFADDGLWFALPYVIVRLLGLGLQVMVELERPAPNHSALWRWVIGSLVGLALVMIGAVADPSLRPWLWSAAIIADLVAAALAGGGEWNLDRSHISERHGLFVIIAIGESLIVAGTGLTEELRTESLIVVTAATLVVACLMWWSYFAWLKDAMEHAFTQAPTARVGQLARDAYSVAHFPLIVGIIGFAVAVKEILHHPDTPLTAELLAMLGFGVALFIGSAALSFWRLSGRTLVTRIAVIALTIAALPFAAQLPPIGPLLVVAVGLLVIVLVEELRPVHEIETDRPADTIQP